MTSAPDLLFPLSPDSGTPNETPILLALREDEPVGQNAVNLDDAMSRAEIGQATWDDQIAMRDAIERLRQIETAYVDAFGEYSPEQHAIIRSSIRGDPTAGLS